jgi:starch synthase
LVNLEAMACETAVVGSAVGGIPEVVAADETGILVPFVPASAEDPAPADADVFAADLAAAIEAVLDDPDRRTALGQAGRQRVVDHFSWSTIAGQTLDLYREASDAPTTPNPGPGASAVTA